ncbi:MAG TPA: hypothetical protein VF021_09170 [Longimicrobiales bacterium]
MKRLAVCLLLLLPACARTGDDSVLHNDSLNVIPVGPGTDSSVLRSPDTPGSRPIDSASADTTHRQRPR